MVGWEVIIAANFGGLPAAARHLELPAGRPNARARVRVRHAGRLAHVLLRRAGLLRRAQEDRALSLFTESRGVRSFRS